MPIICFEGASAVGKTTTANAFKVSHGAFVVPEVNELYTRPEAEPADWYFERQVERWSIAQEQSKDHQLIILDGDPFQPLWYNWAYNFENWQDLNFLERFYRPRVQNKTIRFPDLYFIFSTSEAELRKRKEIDATRRRRGFETHLRMIEPQHRYFRAMQAYSAHRVHFLEAGTIEANMKVIQKNVSALFDYSGDVSEQLFDKMIEWLGRNEA
jgi:thymidylate kinase